MSGNCKRKFKLNKQIQTSSQILTSFFDLKVMHCLLHSVAVIILTLLWSLNAGSPHVQILLETYRGLRRWKSPVTDPGLD